MQNLKMENNPTTNNSESLKEKFFGQGRRFNFDINSANDIDYDTACQIVDIKKTNDTSLSFIGNSGIFGEEEHTNEHASAHNQWKVLVMFAPKESMFAKKKKTWLADINPLGHKKVTL